MKIKAKSFAVPGIEPGVIVEYKYRERFKGDSLSGERLLFQRDIPIQKMTYRVRPYKNMRLIPTFFNMPHMQFYEDSANKGFYIANLNDVPAFKDEPFMPPEDTVKRWAILKYGGYGSFTWDRFSLGVSSFFEKFIKPDDNIRETARSLTAGIATEEAKARKLYEFVQREIRNVDFEDSSNSQDLDLDDAEEVLEKRIGSSGTIDLLFASLAREAGLETYLVFSGNRDDFFFTPNKTPAHLSFVHPAGIAVRINGVWQYFNPGSPFLPFGKMLWYEESVYAMLVGKGKYAWKVIPPSNHKENITKRTGKFELLEDGTLVGTSSVEYNGHQSTNVRQAEYKNSLEKRKENFDESVRDRISTVEISDTQIQNFDSPEKPLIFSHKIRVPNYAQKTGKRMFFQPGVFKYNADPVFSSSTRIHPIYFRYPWAELDEIEIKLPEGYTIENLRPPDSINEKTKLSRLNYSIDFDKETNTLIFKRDFFFGGDNKIIFPSSAYGSIKKLFDLFHKSDTHVISLKLE